MYQKGRKLEETGDFDNAASLYREIRKLESSAYPTLSDCRYALCRIQSGNHQVILKGAKEIESLLVRITPSFEEEKKDIAYRYALHWLKENDAKYALQILDTYLPEEQSLINSCQQQFIISGLNKLADFNQKIEQMHNKTLSSDDALFMINHILEFADEVQYVVSLSRPTLGEYRKALKNYAIQKLFEEGKARWIDGLDALDLL